MDLLEYLNISGDIDSSKLSEVEWKDLNILVPGLLKKQELTLKDTLQPITVLNLQNYSIPLSISLQQSGKYLIEDIFKVEESSLYLAKGEVRYKIPMFRGLTTKQLAECSTINFEVLLKEYQKLHNEVNNIFFDANQYALILITAPDFCEQDKEKKEAFLNTAQQFIQWLFKENTQVEKIDERILKMNELQIFIRQRKLTVIEKEWLYEITDSPDVDKRLKFGAYILLEEKTRAERIFSTFSKKEKEEYKEYPIYILYQKL